MENQHQDQEDSNASFFTKDRTPLFTGLIIILAAIIGFFVYQNYSLSKANTKQAEELGQAVLQLDSITRELDQKIAAISELGGQVDTLVKIREQLENERMMLLTQQEESRELVTSLKDRVSGYRELLLAKDKELEQLKKVNNELLSENTGLKKEKMQLTDSLQEFHVVKSQLEEKVAFASRLKLEGLRVLAVNSSGKEREDEFRNRHISQLKIVFTVAENKVAPIEGKDLLIRIVAPDGNVLFDVTRGSGSFTFEGRELFYTAKKEILYDRSSQEVSITYEKGSEFDLGLHLVEVYTDSYLMGEGDFMVK